MFDFNAPQDLNKELHWMAGLREFIENFESEKRCVDIVGLEKIREFLNTNEKRLRNEKAKGNRTSTPDSSSLGGSINKRLMEELQELKWDSESWSSINAKTQKKECKPVYDGELHASEEQLTAQKLQQSIFSVVDATSNNDAPDVGSNNDAPDVGSNNEAPDVGSNNDASDVGSNNDASDVGGNNDLFVKCAIVYHDTLQALDKYNSAFKKYYTSKNAENVSSDKNINKFEAKNMGTDGKFGRVKHDEQSEADAQKSARKTDKQQVGITFVACIMLIFMILMKLLLQLRDINIPVMRVAFSEEAVSRQELIKGIEGIHIVKNNYDSFCLQVGKSPSNMTKAWRITVDDEFKEHVKLEPAAYGIIKSYDDETNVEPTTTCHYLSLTDKDFTRPEGGLTYTIDWIFLTVDYTPDLQSVKKLFEPNRKYLMKSGKNKLFAYFY